MANTNFKVQNGLTVGPLTIDAATGDITTSGNVTLTGVGSLTAAAGTLTGDTLNPTVVNSSLTSVGTLGSLAVTGAVTAGSVVAGGISIGATANAITSTGTLTLDPNPVGSGGLVVIQGNLQVTGTTTTIDSTTLEVSDLNITVAKGAASAAAANGAGLTVDGASATILYTDATTSWNLNKAVGVNSDSAATALINLGTSGVGNIGASGATFNTIFAKATTAQYADVAENYAGDAAIEPGTVVHFGGEQEVSVCDADMCSAVAGVVSTNPAYLMNSEITAEHVVAVAFTGRVPCKVTGTVRKGDLMVSAGNGRARAEANPRVGSVIGKALENSEGEAVIEVVVGR
jgi:hypothetical protein